MPQQRWAGNRFLEGQPLAGFALRAQCGAQLMSVGSNLFLSGPFQRLQTVFLLGPNLLQEQVETCCSSGELKLAPSSD